MSGRSAIGRYDLDHHGLTDPSRPLEHAQRQPLGDLGPVLGNQRMKAHSGYLSGIQDFLTFDQDRTVVHVSVQFGREAPARSVAREDRGAASTLLGGQEPQTRSDVAVLPLLLLPAG